MHFIHTGIAENCFHILPDGTTVLIDAGIATLRISESKLEPHAQRRSGVRAMPDDSRRSANGSRGISRGAPRT